MVRPAERKLARDLKSRLIAYRETEHNLPGIESHALLDAFVEQLIESTRRIKYVSVIQGRPISDRRTDPSDPLFDPLRASVLFRLNGEMDEAFWMVFLFVHFGKHRRNGWQYARRIYGRLGCGSRWDWVNTTSDPRGFRDWLAARTEEIRAPTNMGGFGNHRKYQSLDAYSSDGTGAAFETYVRWVSPPRSHSELFEETLKENDGDEGGAFDALYKSMNAIASFGRTARFDYLTMVGKLQLASVEPQSPYLRDSTGPLEGCRLLFGEENRPRELDSLAAELAKALGVKMQAMEDALCNWQKGPNRFKPFRG